ncbi:MAG: hypothetical protein GIW99_10725 [Candidatus Eremiobacteraeota bacterium]|nr:hypothetical protein [Candidatus Eremiobacteraeota bacterium]MBC5828136.1 hypothetical protein [Candidatus Eremiobacteraeota bacterium]
MRRLSVLFSTIALLGAVLFVGPLSAQAKNPNVFIGRVDHVSTSNIKVTSARETLSFTLVPRFKAIFSDDGKTTYQMARLRPGTMVKVYYDQKLLGIRHADKIFILRHGHAMSSTKG